MSKLHFLVNENGKIKQNLTHKEYASIAYPILKSLDLGEYSSERLRFTDSHDGVLELLVKRQYVKVELGNYAITTDGKEHLKELEYQI